MELPPLSRYPPQNSKKRVFPGGSSVCVDPDIVEIPRPTSQRQTRLAKQKEVVHYEVIDLDRDEDDDITLIDGRVYTKSNQKEAFSCHSFDLGSPANLGSVDVVHSSKKSNFSGLHNIINLDDLSSDTVRSTDMYYNDLSCEDIDFEVFQSHFDGVDALPGVEASIPWLPDPTQNKMMPSAASGSTLSTLQQPDAVGVLPGKFSSYSSYSHEPVNKSLSSTTISNSGGSIGSGGKVELFEETAPSYIKLGAPTSSTGWSPQIQSSPINNLSEGAEPFESWHSSGSSRSKKRTGFSNSTIYSNHHSRWDQMVLPGISPSNGGGSLFPGSSKMQVDDGTLPDAIKYMPKGTVNPPGTVLACHTWQSSFNKQSFITDPAYSVFNDTFDTVHKFSKLEGDMFKVQGPVESPKNINTAGSSEMPSWPSSSGESDRNKDIMSKFNLFKKFDTVQDYSDHYFARNGSSTGKQSKNWAKKIQDEWRILEKDLPDTIFVRVYESRMDLLRAVIVGAEGTPYHDGLFFFDVLFPSTYPSVPPRVHYHSGGHRINPNLYNCGKVCLSLLNTWSGGKNEKWLPSVSTMLQVLVSIQGLILNAKPYFNEPGYASAFNSASGEQSSRSYNENTFILSLKTMVISMRRPPKHFEDFVVGHFCKHAQDILVACKAYMDGAQVGCLVKGGVQDVDEGDKSCSDYFKRSLAQYINTLVNAFKQIGAKD